MESVQSSGQHTGVCSAIMEAFCEIKDQIFLTTRLGKMELHSNCPLLSSAQFFVNTRDFICSINFLKSVSVQARVYFKF